MWRRKGKGKEGRTGKRRRGRKEGDGREGRRGKEWKKEGIEVRE